MIKAYTIKNIVNQSHIKISYQMPSECLVKIDIFTHFGQITYSDKVHYAPTINNSCLGITSNVILSRAVVLNISCPYKIM